MEPVKDEEWEQLEARVSRTALLLAEQVVDNVSAVVHGAKRLAVEQRGNQWSLCLIAPPYTVSSDPEKPFLPSEEQIATLGEPTPCMREDCKGTKASPYACANADCQRQRVRDLCVKVKDAAGMARAKEIISETGCKDLTELMHRSQFWSSVIARCEEILYV